MEQYISKSALVAEIKRLLVFYSKEIEDNKEDPWAMDIAKRDILQEILSFIDTLEAKEVDMEKEIESYFKGFGKFPSVGIDDCIDIAKHFFELGLKASNPIFEVNLESLVRQVIDLYIEAGKHYDSVIEEERKKYGGSDLAIKLLDGAIDAEELGIQYVLDKLKAQKEE